MKIETKFNINDEVWFIHPVSQKAVSGKVKEIHKQIKSREKMRHGDRRNLIGTGEYMPMVFVTVYIIDDKVREEGCRKTETELFTTKNELIKSL